MPGSQSSIPNPTYGQPARPGRRKKLKKNNTGMRLPKAPKRQNKKIRAAAKKTSALESAYTTAKVKGLTDLSKIGPGAKKKAKKVRKDYVSSVGLKKKRAKKKMSKIGKALTRAQQQRLFKKMAQEYGLFGGVNQAGR